MTSNSTSGCRLTDLAAQTNLAAPTVRRILKRLTEHRLVAQDPRTQRYTLGSFAYELGLASAFKPPIIATMRPVMERLAAALGDTIYLVVRSGHDAVCVDRIEGSFPIKTLTLDVGGRRPLGIGAGGLALLASLPPAEVDEVLAANADLYGKISTLKAETIRRDVARTRKQGYAVRHDGITSGVAGIGMAISNPGGTPFAAISAAMIRYRFDDRRMYEFLRLLRASLPKALGGRSG
jgi:DNA-binding IclR family transcriptional regulator